MSDSASGSKFNRNEYQNAGDAANNEAPAATLLNTPQNANWNASAKLPATQQQVQQNQLVGAAATAQSFRARPATTVTAGGPNHNSPPLGRNGHQSTAQQSQHRHKYTCHSTRQTLTAGQKPRATAPLYPPPHEQKNEIYGAESDSSSSSDSSDSSSNSSASDEKKKSKKAKSSHVDTCARVLGVALLLICLLLLGVGGAHALGAFESSESAEGEAPLKLSKTQLAPAPTTSSMSKATPGPKASKDLDSSEGGTSTLSFFSPDSSDDLAALLGPGFSQRGAAPFVCKVEHDGFGTVKVLSRGAPSSESSAETQSSESSAMELSENEIQLAPGDEIRLQIYSEKKSAESFLQFQLENDASKCTFNDYMQPGEIAVAILSKTLTEPEADPHLIQCFISEMSFLKSLMKPKLQAGASLESLVRMSPSECGEVVAALKNISSPRGSKLAVLHDLQKEKKEIELAKNTTLVGGSATGQGEGNACDPEDDTEAKEAEEAARKKEAEEAARKKEAEEAARKKEEEEAERKNEEENEAEQKKAENIAPLVEGAGQSQAPSADGKGSESPDTPSQEAPQSSSTSNSLGPSVYDYVPPPLIDMPPEDRTEVLKDTGMLIGAGLGAAVGGPVGYGVGLVGGRLVGKVWGSIRGSLEARRQERVEEVKKFQAKGDGKSQDPNLNLGRKDQNPKTVGGDNSKGGENPKVGGNNSGD